MTPPSTSKNNDHEKKQQYKLAIIMTVIVAPILVIISILIGIGIIDLDFSDEFNLPRLDTFPDYLLAPKQIFKTTNLFNLGMSLQNEIALVEDIFSKTNLKCLNVNWYGDFGGGKRQIFYNNSVEEIQVALIEMGITQDMTETEQSPFLLFLENKLVQTYAEIHCPHVENLMQVPDKYNPKTGINAYYICQTHPFFDDKEYCTFLPKQLTT